MADFICRGCHLVMTRRIWVLGLYRLYSCPYCFMLCKQDDHGAQQALVWIEIDNTVTIENRQEVLDDC